MKQIKLYMCVTHDKYELPLFVTDSLDEMARFTGKKKSNILTCISHSKNGRIKGRFRTVMVDDDEGDEEGMTAKQPVGKRKDQAIELYASGKQDNDVAEEMVISVKSARWYKCMYKAEIESRRNELLQGQEIENNVNENKEDETMANNEEKRGIALGDLMGLMDGKCEIKLVEDGSVGEMFVSGNAWGWIGEDILSRRVLEIESNEELIGLEIHFEQKRDGGSDEEDHQRGSDEEARS